MATLYLSPAGMLLQQLSNLGVPLGGGFVNVLVAGSVSTPQTSFTDSTGLTPNAQPIVLNSGGRLAAGNAPVSIWVPANTPHKITVTDSQGNLLSGGAPLDNLFGINDPTAVNSGLANPATGFGVDLVANAMKSYDLFSSVRAANVPSPAAGQTLIIEVEGALSVGDGLGGEFYWSASSVAAEDGVNVLKPTAAGASGRYLRIPLGASGFFTATTTDVGGGTSSGPVFYTRIGNLVTLTSNTTFTGTSGTTTFNLAIPSANSILWPTRAQNIAGLVPGAADNSVACLAAIQVLGSNIVLSKVAAGAATSGAWTAAGTKTMPPFTFTYSIG
jgi:hypothetical protein